MGAGLRGVLPLTLGCPSQVSIQSLRDTDRPSVPHQCRVRSAAAAALHGHGGTSTWRPLLGESSGDMS